MSLEINILISAKSVIQYIMLSSRAQPLFDELDNSCGDLDANMK
jgi:hypothetical protein